jgi:hypothetical protein
MATVAETLALYQKALVVRNTVEPLQADSVSDYQSFINGGYKQPNAQSTYDTIAKTRADYKARLTSEFLSTQKAAGDAFDTLSDSQKIEVNTSQVLINFKNVGAKIGSNNATLPTLEKKAKELLSQHTTANASTGTTTQPTTQPGTVPPAGGETKPLTGSADGDSGQKQDNPAGSVTGSPSANTTGGDTGEVPGVTTVSGEGTASANPTSQDANTSGTDDVVKVISGPQDNTSPGKRLKNPLGNFSSYTYQLSLYMITPDAYNAFIASGRREINVFNDALGPNSESGGAFLIAQSGGINNTTSKRAPGFTFDYGIDNLSFTTYVNGKSNGTSTNSTTFKFNIVEPYGFSFITRLKDASNAISEYAGQTGNAWPANPSKNFFILGVRFFGYDASGNIITGRETYDGNTLDPTATGNGLFQTYFDIIITSMKFKIDGKATTYNITAESMPPQTAFTVKRGMINGSKEITAGTVQEAFQDLFGKLNKEQDALLKSNSIGKVNKYKVRFVGDASEIAAASLVTPEDLDKFKWPGSGAKNSKESSAAREVVSKPNNTKRTITFNNDTPILQAISDIVKQSTYLRDALQVVYTTALENDKKKDGTVQNKPDTKKIIKWYNCSAEISEIDWDDVVKDWAYTMTYVIQTYETPVIDSSYANPGKKYYGPHKRYEYWYTGKNSEVLEYVQNLDNTFFNVSLAGDAGTPTSGSGGNAAPSSTSTGTTSAGSGNSGGSGGATGVPKVVNKRTAQNRTGKLGNALEAQNNYLTSLWDPGAYATAKITILGDPDFLVSDSPGSENQIYSKFYGDNGFTVNPNGGQVFIEIDFKEAVDYTSGGGDNLDGTKQAPGTLNINESILFWKYPEEVSKQIKGVSYLVTEVASTFANGSFKQLLTAVINDFGDPESANEDKSRPADSAENGSQPNPGPAAAPNSNASTPTTGLKSDNPSNQSKVAYPNGAFRGQRSDTPAAPATTPTKSGPVADDDAGG